MRGFALKKRIGDRGIFLTEVMVSICMLTLVILITIPVLTHVYQERIMLQKKNEAIRLLRYHLMQWKADSLTFPENQADPAFSLHWEKKTDHSAVLSVSWSDGKHRFIVRSEARK